MGLSKYKIGQQFGRLTIIKRVGTGQFGSALWKCACECGNSCIVTSQVFTGKLTSCGCWHKEHCSRIGKSNQLPYGESEFNAIYSNYKRQAKNRGLRFDLNKKRFRKLISKNCVYCGSTPNNTHKGVKGQYIYNGIDRIDSTKGYTEYNIVPCCGYCNKAKGKKTVEDFIQWLDQLVEYRNKMTY
ncbi:hypothetical protein LCGC14_0278460 [marine sediment metagenome]|uniref:Uncharacterized protein n=1 Tax=marine sediment metagenome TaxID=412755 RepID=A0A0F9X252_9ZZZZ